MKTLINVLFLAALTGCSFEMPEESETKDESSGETSETVEVVKDPADRREPEQPVTEPTKAPEKQPARKGNPSQSVNVEVNVEVNQTVNGGNADETINEPETELVEGEEYYYLPRAMTHAEFMKLAPNGYRPMKRSEIVDAYESGDFDWASNQILNVWSADTLQHDQYSQPEAWYVGLNNGQTYHYFQTYRAYGVYKRVK
jgi:hypothetical protein